MKATAPYSRTNMTLPAEQLETKRLILRPLVAGDMDCLVEMDTDEEVMRYIPGYWISPEKLDKFREGLLNDFAAGERFKFFYAIEEKDAPGKAVGWLLLRPTEDGKWVELGYRLVQRAWGKGIVTEASRACLRAAFDIWQVPEVMAVIYPGNIKSARVVEKLGFQPHGRMSIYDMDLECFLLASSDFTA